MKTHVPVERVREVRAEGRVRRLILGEVGLRRERKLAELTGGFG